MRTGMVLGILGGLTGISACVVGFFVYLVEGTNGTGNTLAPRLGFLAAALILAVVVGVGGALAVRRPEPASVLMLSGSIGGTIAMSLFYLNTWFALAVPLCLLGAALALNGAGHGAGAHVLRATVFAVVAGLGVLSYFVAGALGVALCVALLIVVGVLQLTRPAWIP